MDPTPLLLSAALMAGLVVQLVLPGVDLVSGALHPRRLGRRPPVATTPPPLVLAGYPAIAARPLFAPSRSAQAVATAADIAPVGSFALLGVASGRSGATAVLRAQDGSTHVVALGEALLGWRLAAVTRDQAVLNRAGATQMLRVGAPPLTPAPAAAPGTPR